MDAPILGIKHLESLIPKHRLALGSWEFLADMQIVIC